MTAQHVTISRRDFLQVGMAASAIVGASGFGEWAKLAAQQTLTQDQLLQFLGWEELVSM